MELKALLRAATYFAQAPRIQRRSINLNQEGLTMTRAQRTLLAALPILGMLVSSCSSAPAATSTPEAAATISEPSVIVAEGRLEPIRYAQLALNTSGLVSEVLYEEGATVRAGDVIARLENAEARTLETAQADALHAVTVAYQAVRDAQYKLDIFDIPAEFKESTATEAVRVTEERLNAAREAFEPYKHLNEKSLELTDREEDEPMLRSTPKRLKKELDDAWDDYRNSVTWLDRESALANARAELAQAQKDYDSLHDASFGEDTAGVRAALANAEVRAPFSGTITDLELKVGEFAAAGTTVVTIADLSNWVVKTTDLTEIDVVNIRGEEAVTLTLDAMPDVELDGHVFSIAQNFAEKQGDIVYEVTILLADANPDMRWGMTAQVNFPR
jgi:multidrug efflux pump subunit AcrA (membrane-fusion protein)